MKFKRHFIAYLVMCLFMITMIKKQQVSSSFARANMIEEMLSIRYRQAQEKFQLKRKQEQEIELKRFEIFHNHLLGRVFGSVLKDFYSRF